ncbi:MULTISPECIES: hypothetical protein [unclassified Aliiroseovarius]|uniref:hypothetical protein n=1 Tax=unclassified Aliiroseovarius TaxID=2623558 RepID=UPI001569F8F6|nr:MULTISPECIES: hypothetical protein [unclassified Aliiroseovarius]NRP30876.1 hypothetical protein [Aliiroseovarius sp. xm-m-314]NRP80518.1 hypothetical protein [Aliiroseovarius sp. xm-v-209]
MKKILQNLSTGECELVEALETQAQRASMLIDETLLLNSTGTSWDVTISENRA